MKIDTFVKLVNDNKWNDPGLIENTPVHTLTVA